MLNPTLEPPPPERVLSRWLNRLTRQLPAALRTRATLEDAQPLPAWSPATEAAVGKLEDFLLQLAEGGRRSVACGLAERLEEHAARLRSLGLEALGNSLAGLIREPGCSASLPSSRYLCQVHRQAAVRLRLASG